jgi:hypothetical protein
MNNRMVSFENINESKDNSYAGIDLSKENDRTTYVILSESQNKTEDNSSENNADDDAE